MRLTSPTRRKKSGVNVLTDAGVLVFANKRAQALLTSHFPAWTAREPLPKPLRIWITEAVRVVHHPRGLVTEPLLIEREGRKLSTHMVITEREKILLLDEEQIASDGPSRKIASLRVLGVTEREAEVLSWVAEGKSNPEIGIILRIALPTVKKHLEHIFSKLGVEGRTCAAARASEVLYGARSSKRRRVRR